MRCANQWTLKLPNVLDTAPPVVDFQELLSRMNWRQGDHVGLIGPTDCGKTTLAYTLLPMREYVTAIVTKPASASADRFFVQQDYKLLNKWPIKEPAHVSPRRLLWPTQKRMGDINHQQYEIWTALDNIFVTGGWCVYFDELKYVCEQLGLKREVLLYWLQGRELGISVVAASQRPKWIPLEMFDQSTHLFFWNERDDVNLSRIAGISSMDTMMIRHTVRELEPHQFLYLNTRTAEMMRSIAPNPDGR